MTISDQHEAAAPPREQMHFSAVGRSATRVDSVAKVVGATRYSSDFYPRGMLHAKLLFSDRPRARIVSIDTTLADALPGVAAVITGDDTPDHRYGLYLHDQPILAKAQVNYVGEYVAAVAATSERIATVAIGLIDVVYEDLPPLLDTESALMEDAPQLHPEVADYASDFPYVRYGNVCMETNLQRGDVVEAMASADVVIEGTYRTPAINQAPIEPHACVAGFDDRGQLTVWTATQQLSICHAQLANALGLPMAQVRVIPLASGGGFGGKLGTNLEPVTALLAQQTNQSVRLAMSREEEFLASNSRAPFTIRIVIGAKFDGTLVAGDADIVADAGGYANEVVRTAMHALASADGAYRFPALKARSRAVYTNNPDYGCMRGFGTYQMLFALETHLDVVARQLDIDPVELRMKNLIRDGDQLLTTQTVDGVQIRATMERALEQSGYWKKKGHLGPNRGIGLANIAKCGGLLSSSASVRLHLDGTVVITTAAVEIGTGTHTILPQIAAEVLDIPFEQVSVAAPDSETAPFDLGSIASRTLFDNGSAVRLAAEDLRNQIALRAAEVFACDSDEVIVSGGSAYARADSEAQLDFATIAGISAFSFGGPAVGTGRWHATSNIDPPVGNGFAEPIIPSIGYGTHVVEVEVDPDTGRTKVLNYTACHDVGRAINPMAAEGQIEGGIVQGLGAGLWEEMVITGGYIDNPNFVDYRLPTILDAPPIRVSFVEEPDPIGPFGAKGIAEHPILGPGPAVANAIADATGVQVTQIPITPERLHSLMHHHE